jgi:hypothetical protein
MQEAVSAFNLALVFKAYRTLRYMPMISTPAIEDPSAKILPQSRSIVPKVAVLALCIVSTLVVYYPAWTADFVADDFLFIGEVIRGEAFMPREKPGGFLRPVVMFSYWLEYHLWGLHAWAFHLTNVLVHALNAFLLAWLARQFLHILNAPESQRRLIPPLSALLFVVLPCHSEAVSWIAGRNDLYATGLMLLSLNCWLHFMCRPTAIPLLASLLTFFIALFTKESTLALPFILAVVTAWIVWMKYKTLNLKKTLPHLLTIAVIYGGYFLVRLVVIGEFVGGYGARGHLRFGKSLIGGSLGRFSVRTFLPPLPENFCAFWEPYSKILIVVFLLTALLLFITLLLWSWKDRRASVLVMLFCAYWAALLPVMNVSIPLHNTQGERFLYLATAFACVAVSYAAVTWFSGRKALVLLLLYMVMASPFTFNLATHWNRAGQIAHQVAEDIREQATQSHIVFFNTPNKYHGAYIYLTGLKDAVTLFGQPTRVESVDVLSTVLINESVHPIELHKDPNRDWAYTLSIHEGTSRIYRTHTDLVEFEVEKSSEVSFHFKESPEATDLFYYSNGRAMLLESAP